MQKLYGYFWTNFLDCHVLLLEPILNLGPFFCTFKNTLTKITQSYCLQKKKAVQKWLQTNNQQEPKDFGADFLKETPLTPSLNSVVFRTLSNIYDETFWLKRAQPVNYFCYKLHLSLTGFRICRRLELIKISLEISKLILLKKMFLNNGLGVGVLTPFNYFYYSFIWMFY